MVEQPAVNRLVVGSNPTRGARSNSPVDRGDGSSKLAVQRSSGIPVTVKAASLVLLCLLFAAPFGGRGAAADLPEDVLFRGARMGMARADLLALPMFKERQPECAHIILVGQPRNTRVAQCTFTDRTPSGAPLTTTYLLSSDPSQVERIINMALRGEPADGPWALAYLKARFGEPSYEARRRQLDSDGQPQRATVWQIAGRQIMYRQKCKTAAIFCVDYSDSPFARQVTQQLGDI